MTSLTALPKSEMVLQAVACLQTDAGLPAQTVKDIFGGLPGRFKSEKAGGFGANVHFDISGDQGGQFTVHIADGKCEVQEGLQGDRDCLVETDDETYIGIESGKLNPQTAFMSGKIKADNLAVMMQFSGLFRRLN